MLNTIITYVDIIVAALITISIVFMVVVSSLLLFKGGRSVLAEIINNTFASNIFTWTNLINWVASIAMMYVFYVHGAYYTIYASIVGTVVSYGIIAWAHFEGKRITA